MDILPLLIIIDIRVTSQLEYGFLHYSSLLYAI